MAKELCNRATDALSKAHSSTSYDIITVIPPSLKGDWKRDFHLPYLCALTLKNSNNQFSNIPILQILSHHRYVTPQASLKIKKRIANMKDKWTIRMNISGGKILLIDDIITTGSTAISATTALLNAGASQVDLLALTRSPVFETVKSTILQYYAPCESHI